MLKEPPILPEREKNISEKKEEISNKIKDIQKRVEKKKHQIDMLGETEVDEGIKDWYKKIISEDLSRINWLKLNLFILINQDQKMVLEEEKRGIEDVILGEERGYRATNYITDDYLKHLMERYKEIKTELGDPIIRTGGSNIENLKNLSAKEGVIVERGSGEEKRKEDGWIIIGVDDPRITSSARFQLEFKIKKMKEKGESSILIVYKTDEDGRDIFKAIPGRQLLELNKEKLEKNS